MGTTQEQLEQINQAIANVEIGGQEVRIYNRQVRRADLSQLYKRKKELEQQLEDDLTPPNAFGHTYAAVFERR